MNRPRNIQYRFRKNVSIANPITEVMDYVHDSQDNLEKFTSILLDLAKTFDPQDHTIELNHLEKMGELDIALKLL